MSAQKTPTKLDHYPPRWAGLDETASYLGVCTKSVRRYIAAGIFPAHRMGKRLVRVDLNHVDAAMRRIPTAGGDAA